MVQGWGGAGMGGEGGYGDASDQKRLSGRHFGPSECRSLDFVWFPSGISTKHIGNAWFFKAEIWIEVRPHSSSNLSPSEKCSFLLENLDFLRLLCIWCSPGLQTIDFAYVLQAAQLGIH